MEHLPAIDWAFAASTARGLLSPGPELSTTAIAGVVAELRAAAARATGHVADVTRLDRPAPADVLLLDRATWVEAVCESAGTMLAGVTGPGLLQPATSSAAARAGSKGPMCGVLIGRPAVPVRPAPRTAAAVP